MLQVRLALDVFSMKTHDALLLAENKGVGGLLNCGATREFIKAFDRQVSSTTADRLSTP